MPLYNDPVLKNDPNQQTMVGDLSAPAVIVQDGVTLPSPSAAYRGKVAFIQGADGNKMKIRIHAPSTAAAVNSSYFYIAQPTEISSIGTLIYMSVNGTGVDPVSDQPTLDHVAAVLPLGNTAIQNAAVIVAALVPKPFTVTNNGDGTLDIENQLFGAAPRGASVTSLYDEDNGDLLVPGTNGTGDRLYVCLRDMPLQSQPTVTYHWKAVGSEFVNEIGQSNGGEGTELLDINGLIALDAWNCNLVDTTTPPTGSVSVSWVIRSLYASDGTSNLSWFDPSNVLVNFTVSDAAKWAGSPPTTMNDAINRIAAVVGASIPIP